MQAYKKNIIIFTMFLLLIPFVSSINFFDDLDMKGRNIENVTNVTAVKYFGDGSSLTGVSGGDVNGTTINVTQIYITNNTHNDRGSCPNRPLVSNGNRTINVPSEYATINEAICQVPYFLDDVYTISVNPTTYNAAMNCSENVSVSNVHATKSMDYKGGSLRFTGGSSSNLVCVNSFIASGMTGQENPKIQYYKINGWNSDYSLSSNCQLCMFGVQQFDLYRINFTSSWDNRNETHAILAYGGTKGKLSGITISNSSWFGVSAKQGSEIWIRDEGIVGNAKAIAYGVSIGNIWTRDEVNATSSFYGGSTIGNYATDQGLLIWSDNANGYNQSVGGIDRLPDLDELTLGSGAINYRDSAYRGFRYYYDASNNLQLERKTASSTYTSTQNISLSTGEFTQIGDFTVKGNFSLNSNDENDDVISLSGNSHYMAPNENEFFCAGSASCYEPFEGNSIASGTVGSSIAGTLNHVGIKSISTSTTASSGYSIALAQNAMLLSGGEVFTIIFAPIAKTGNVTEIKTGFIDQITASDPVDGLYLNITQNSSTTFNVVGLWRNNSVTLNTTSTTYQLTNGTWYKARVKMNSATSGTFTIYNEAGTSLWTSTITAGAFAAGRENSAGITTYTTGGTTAQQLVWLDYMGVKIERYLTR